jgi:sortase A
MRIVVAKAPVRRILRWTRRGLFVVAFSLLAYCGFVLLDAWSFQREADRRLERMLTSQLEAAGVRQASTPASPQPSPKVAPGGLIGRIDIPRLGISVIVVEGTAARTLRRSVGHIRGTALPGEPGNVGISGHRDTFFRPLRNVRQGDLVALTTLTGEYRYRVVSTKVVPPEDVAVLDAGRDESLTLVTCYPFYYVGPAPSRFIVRAARAE